MVQIKHTKYSYWMFEKITLFTVFPKNFVLQSLKTAQIIIAKQLM